jgi:serine/threonine protein kinase
MFRLPDPQLLAALEAFEQQTMSSEDLAAAVLQWAQRCGAASPSDLDTQAASNPGQMEHSSVDAPETLDLSAGSRKSELSVLIRDRQSRFVHLRPHAKGGLGQVSIALDCQLNRRVALKEILPHRATDPDSQRRFLAEGEITGQLEHPGIVPVYGLGVDEAGRPYYAMRFVEGENLKRAIETFHDNRGPNAELIGQRAVDFRSLLGRFVDVCNAIEYAHSRQVLHRDLKPENILLGPYGETLVVDWGLAKSLGEDESLGGPLEEMGEKQRGVRLRSGTNSDTLDGVAIGTPAYMSPEQADGKIQELGLATDVYSLGATLYAILTGKPPVKGDSVIETLEKVRRNDFERPRAAWKSVPRALEAVCLKAMALRPEDRYASSRELADEIDKWLADEPVKAYAEPLTARTKRWIKRHPALVSSTTAGVALALIGALVIAYLQGAHALELEGKNSTIGQQVVQLTTQNQTIQQQNTQLAKTNLDLSAANEKERQAREQEAIARKDAEQQRDLAESVTDFLVKSFRRASPDEDGRKLTVADSLVRSLKEIDEEVGLDPLNKAEILSAMREAFRGLAMPAEELEAARRTHQIFSQALPPHHPDTLYSKSNLALAMSSTGNTAEAVKLLEETMNTWNTHYGEKHDSALISKANLASAYKDMGRLDLALSLSEEVYEAMKAGAASNSPRTLTLQNNLAGAYSSLGNKARAIELYLATLKSQKEIYGPDHPQVLTTQSNLATCYNDGGQPELGMPLLEATLNAAKVRLGEDHLTTLIFQSNLARQLLYNGRYQEANELFFATLAAERAKLGDQHPSVLRTEENLAATYAALGQHEIALQRYEAVYAKAKSVLGEDHPSTMLLMNDMATTIQSLGRLEDATSLLESALAKRKLHLGDDHPDTLTSQNNLAGAYQEANRFEEASDLYQKTLEAQKIKMGADHPYTLATQNNLASVYRHLRKLELAIPLAEEAYQTFGKKYGLDHPNTITGGSNVALLYSDAKQFDKAIDTLRNCLEAARRVRPEDSETTLLAQLALAGIYFVAQRPEEGEATIDEYLARAKKIDGEDINASRRHHIAAAMKLREAGRLTKSESLLRELIALAKLKAPGQLKTILCLNALAEILSLQDKTDEAIAVYQESFLALASLGEPDKEIGRKFAMETAEVICELYVELGRDEELAKWRAKIEELRKAPDPPPPLE